MTKEQLYQLDNRLHGSLPVCPWQAVENATTGFFHILDGEGRLVARVDRGWDLDRQTAEFIAHARLDLMALVQEVLRGWEQIGKLEEEVEELLQKLAWHGPDSPGGCLEVVR